MEQLKLLYAGLPPSIAGTVILATLCVFVLWSTVAHDSLFAWVGAQAALSAWRLFQWNSYRRTEQHASPAALLKAFRISIAAAGAIWGAVAVACYPPDLPHQVFLAFVIAGVTSSAITSLSADRRASLSFLICSITPLAIQLFRTPHEIGIVMGVMVILFLVFTSLSARRAYAQFVDNIRLRAQAIDSRAELADALLKMSQARVQLETFIEHAPAAVAMFDSNLCYLAHSRRWATDYQLEGRQLIGRSHYDVFPEIGADWKAIHRRCLDGAIEYCDENPFWRADGTVQWLHWEVRPWRDAQENIGGIVMMSEDITARRAASEALRTSNELLRKLSDRVPGVIYQYCQHASGRREFLFVSAGVRDILGLDAQQLLTDATLLLRSVHPDDRPAVLAHFTVQPEQNTLRSCDYRVLSASGNERWIRDDAVAEIQADGNVLSYGHITDITDRKSKRLPSLIDVPPHMDKFGQFRQ
jgi:PAS domain S-box-containing protein